MCFPVDFAKFLRTTSWWNMLEQLLRNSRTLDNYWKAWESSRECRNRRPEVFYEKIVHKNFAKFTVKDLSQSHPFNKVAGLSPLRLLHRCFPVNFTPKKVVLLPEIGRVKIFLSHPPTWLNVYQNISF